jgi:leader peptidase (prepilin peptidase)/N-methyltransferase
MLVVVGLSGLVVGSFLDVGISGLSRAERLVSSRCPACAEPTQPSLSVVTWLVRRGRCPACRGWLRLRGPLLEVGTAVVFIVLYARLAALGQLAAAPAFLTFAAVGLALALIDAQTHRLPDRLVLPSYPVLAALLAGASGLRADWWSFVRAIIGGAVLFSFFLLVVLAYPAGLGFGDVKFAGLVGGVLAYLSWSALILGVFAGFLFAAIVGVLLLAAGRASGSTQMAFGPFMVLGALLGVIAAG